MPTSLRVLALIATVGLTVLIVDVVGAPSPRWFVLAVAGVSVFYLLWLAGVLVYRPGRK